MNKKQIKKSVKTITKNSKKLEKLLADARSRLADSKAGGSSTFDKSVLERIKNNEQIDGWWS